jgi:hypothetical protein
MKILRGDAMVDKEIEAEAFHQANHLFAIGFL